MLIPGPYMKQKPVTMADYIDIARIIRASRPAIAAPTKFRPSAEAAK